MVPTAGRKSSLAAQAGLSWQQVHVAIVSLGERASGEQLELLHSLLAQFVAENEDPRTSPHLRATAPDQLDPLVALLGRADVGRAADTRLLALQALKILARRQDVRLRCSQHVLDVVAPLLDADKQPTELASEAANALSNLCYEAANCSALLRAGGVGRLLKLLAGDGAGINGHVNAAGALQTLSFQPDARAALLKAGGPATLLHCLASCCTSISNGPAAGAASVSAASGDGKLQQRLVGALHNLSSGAEGIAAIRQQGGIPAIVQLLPSQHPGVAASAAGALQNMSREEQARADIRACPDAVSGLTALLVGADMQAAVCAAGALANLAEGGGCSTEALTQALAGALAGGAIHHSLFGMAAAV